LFRILFKYQDNNTLTLAGRGSGGLAELVNHFEEGERSYAYLKVKWGDDLSTREKFVLITWVGEKVPPLKKARVSTDKAFVKEVVKVRHLNRAVIFCIFECCEK
jgi:hypothetical protein